MNRASVGRVFIIMQEEDKGSGKKGMAQGYLKLEVKQHEIKMLIHVQNIANIEPTHKLEAYLLSSVKKINMPLLIGSIALKSGCGDSSSIVSKQQLAKANVQSRELDTIIILCRDIDKGKIISFPLVGFKNAEWDWRTVFKEYEAKRIGEEKKNEKATKSSAQQENSIKKEVSAENEMDDIVYGKKQNHEQQEKREETKIKNKQRSQEEAKQQTNTNQTENIIPGFSKLRVVKDPMSEGYVGFEWRLVQNYQVILQTLYTANNHAITQMAFQIMNHFYTINAIRRYGYYLVGVLSDGKACPEKIAWAIPAKYGIEPHPLLHIQAHASWVAQTGEKKEIGAFGYWSVVIDIKKGMLVD